MNLPRGVSPGYNYPLVRAKALSLPLQLTEQLWLLLHLQYGLYGTALSSLALHTSVIIGASEVELLAETKMIPLTVHTERIGRLEEDNGKLSHRLQASQVHCLQLLAPHWDSNTKAYRPNSGDN